VIAIDLIYNLALLVALSSVSGFIGQRWENGRAGALLQGLVFGCVAVIGMLRPLVLAPGLIFDGRSVMISLCGLFFGPVAVAVAGGMAMVCRTVQGGVGAPMGVCVILSSALLGWFFHVRWIQSHRGVSAPRLLGFGVLVHLAMVLLMFLLPAGMVFPTMKRIGPPVILLYPLATVLIGKILSDYNAMYRSLSGLRESEEQYRLLFTNASEGILIVTGDRIQLANPAFSTIVGYPLDIITGRPFVDFIHPADRDLVLDRYSRRIRGETVATNYPFRIIGADGRETWLQINTSTISWRGVPASLSFVTDITERKQAEAEKNKLQAQLLQAQKMESVGRLAGGVAHDFNNMLSIIIGYAELALEGLLPSDPLYGSIREIVIAGERSTNVVRQLLAFARKQTIAPRILNLNDTVSGVLNMLKRLMGEDIDLLWKPEADLWPVKMDPAQIDQMLANLVVNARDAISGVGKLTIETANTQFDEAYCEIHPGFVSGFYVMLAVSDDGCGMDKETMATIFEPFFTTKELGKGTGLGLAMIYGIVKQNGGFINVYSEPGKGSTFRIYFPREMMAVATGLPAVADAVPTGTETVLLVEDEPVILKLGKAVLEQLGYTVLTAGTPGEALRLAGEHDGEIHLLMTDVVMPEMNGRDLSGRLLSLFPNLKYLFMSGYTANVIAHHGVLDEGVHFLQKPFSRKELAVRVREALEAEPRREIKRPCPTT
jgi:two-component system sensor histidine kinase EvgS